MPLRSVQNSLRFCLFRHGKVGVAPNPSFKKMLFFLLVSWKYGGTLFAGLVDVFQVFQIGFFGFGFASRILWLLLLRGVRFSSARRRAGRGGVLSELAAVVDEGPGRAVQGLARGEGHLTAAAPIHGGVVQADPLRLEHLSHRVEVLLLARVARGRRRRACQVAQVPARLVQVPRSEAALVGHGVVARLLAAAAVAQRGGAAAGGRGQGVVGQGVVHRGAAGARGRALHVAAALAGCVQAHGLQIAVVGPGAPRPAAPARAACAGALAAGGAVQGALAGRVGAERQRGRKAGARGRGGRGQEAGAQLSGRALRRPPQRRHDVVHAEALTVRRRGRGRGRRAGLRAVQA